MKKIKDSQIAVVGLGYVGLPLAVEFGKHFNTIGFDINQSRIKELKNGNDSTMEVSKDNLESSENLIFSNDAQDIKDSNIFIITVPTPIDRHKNPNLKPLISAGEIVGNILKKDDIVIYESTVYPGATEEVCVPVLEKQSGFVFNKDFYCGYSPERINPGDKEHGVTTIMKVTSGSTPEVADLIDELYKIIIMAGTHKAESIKVAEAAKVIENTQRDINIALMNELSMIFKKLNIDTEAVLKAAGTKWNFLPFRPGLVGGHCIGIDPYYLTHKTRGWIYILKLFLRIRRINDGMAFYVIDDIFKLMNKKQIQIVDANILIMGLAFKKNCPDIRNSKVVNLVKGFDDYNCNIDVFDPWVNRNEAEEYGIKLIKKPTLGKYDVIILAVAHNQFLNLSVEEIKSYGKEINVIYDIKYLLSSKDSDGRL